MWSGWNSQSRWIREVVEFDWRVFFVDSGVWVVPSDGGKGQRPHVIEGRLAGVEEIYEQQKYRER